MPFDIVLVVQGFPESLVFVFLLFAFLGVKAPLARMVLFALLNLGLYTAVRSMGAPFPAHTLVALVIVSIVISLWQHIALYRVIYAWVFGMAVLILSETCFSVLVTSVMGTPAAELLADPWLWTLVGLPHIAVMALVAWWAHRRGGVWPCRVESGRRSGRSV